MKMTWKEIQKKYPDQWVGLINVMWKDRSNIESADVRYTEADIDPDHMVLKAFRKEIGAAVFTTPHEGKSLGALTING